MTRLQNRNAKIDEHNAQVSRQNRTGLIVLFAMLALLGIGAAIYFL